MKLTDASAAARRQRHEEDLAEYLRIAGTSTDLAMIARRMGVTERTVWRWRREIKNRQLEGSTV